MRSWVEVSLGTIRANYRAVREVVKDTAEIMPVVKADAYRHGAVEVSHALEAEGAPWLAVSNAEEGVALRQAGLRGTHSGHGRFPSSGAKRAKRISFDSGYSFA